MGLLGFVRVLWLIVMSVDDNLNGMVDVSSMVQGHMDGLDSGHNWIYGPSKLHNWSISMGRGSSE